MSQEQIIADIRREAEQEAETIRARHRESLARRTETLTTREKQIADDANARAEEQEREIATRASREADREERRIARVLEERAVQSVLSNVRTRLEDRRNTGDYREILTAWAIEAIIGLGEPSGVKVILRCAPVDRELLDSAVSWMERRCGVTIRIEPSEDLSGTIGVVALDDSGRRAYSNTAEDRLRRSEQDIHRLVMSRLFCGSESDE